jgi:hypothetical protein
LYESESSRFGLGDDGSGIYDVRKFKK